MPAPNPDAPAIDSPPVEVGNSTTARSIDRLPPGSGLIIGLLIVSAFVVLLNEMMLGVALPTLIVDLSITPTTGQWLTTGYLLTLAVLIPATGFVMRRFHIRAIFLSSMSLFTIGTVTLPQGSGPSSPAHTDAVPAA